MTWDGKFQYCGVCRVSFATADNERHVREHVWAIHFGTNGWPLEDKAGVEEI